MTGSKNRIQVWSCGGGVQSAAIGALICRGDLERPDVAIIVDTEREVSQTWKYFDEVLFPHLLRAGVYIHRIKKSSYATKDLYGGRDGKTLLIPAFTDRNGSIGKLPTYCSNEWKVRVIQRACRHMFGGKAAFTMWLGISRDEAHRMNFSTGKWQNFYPLIANKRLMSRADCITLVRNMGWPEAPKSRCWMCPNQSRHEWNDLEKNHPEDYARAMEFERKVQKIDPSVRLRDDSASQGACMSGVCFV